MSYAQKLKDPRWQKLRLLMMERDGWACRLCGDGSETLNVHHLYYLPRTDPWMYPDTAYLTTCETCHKRIHEAKEALERAISHVIKREKGRLCLSS